MKQAQAAQKGWLNFSGLNGVLSQKIELSSSKSVRKELRLITYLQDGGFGVKKNLSKV
jgi:hypothetical protein